MGKTDSRKSILAQYFPMIRTRDEILQEIADKPELSDMFYRWKEKDREEFLNFCTGMKGVKILLDGVFKEIFNPEIVPERLESMLTLILKKKISIESVLPNDSVRLGVESSLLYTDLMIQETDGSLANVEIQKIGYAFPGQRCACYSSDNVMRQYKRARGRRGKRFSYRDVKDVHTIVFFEQSPKEFKEYPGDYVHIFRHKSDTGLEMDLLQEYVFIALDIFKKTMENKSTDDELEAWLTFLSFDEPERIVDLITRFPEFKTFYQEIYELCMNTERVMSMYSKELQEMDRNTTLYMLDELQAEVNRTADALAQISDELAEKSNELMQKDNELAQRDQVLTQKNSEIADRDRKIEALEAELAKLRTEK